MDVMLTIIEDAGIAGFDADTINKATCLVNIFATKLLKILFSFHDYSKLTSTLPV